LNVIGGSAAGTADVIAGNSTGVEITGTGTDSNSVTGDEIGVNAADNAALPNYFGVSLAAGASSNFVEYSVISGNYDGVVLTDAGTTGNEIIYNHIGTDATGTINLGNFVDGVFLNGTSGNLIDGDTVANSGMYGILIGVGDGDTIGDITYFNNLDGN
jgi:hypothetical protein